MECINWKKLPRNSRGQVLYRGRWMTPNQPTKSWRKGKKRAVLAVRGNCAKVVHFGAEGYRHNYSDKARYNYLRRSAGIVDGSGRPTKNNIFSPNYWSRRVLWEE